MLQNSSSDVPLPAIENLTLPDADQDFPVAIPEHDALQLAIPKLHELFSKVDIAFELVDKYNLLAEDIIEGVCRVVGDGAAAFNRVLLPMELDRIVDRLEPTGIESNFNQFKGRICHYSHYRFANMLDSIQPEMWKVRLALKVATSAWQNPTLRILRDAIDVTAPEDRDAILLGISQREADAASLLGEFARVVTVAFRKTEKEMKWIEKAITEAPESEEMAYSIMKKAFSEDPGSLDKESFKRSLMPLIGLALRTASSTYIRLRSELKNHLTAKHAQFRNFIPEQLNVVLVEMEDTTPALPSLRDNLMYLKPIRHLELRRRDQDMGSDYEDSEDDGEVSQSSDEGRMESFATKEKESSGPLVKYRWIEGKLGRSYQTVVRAYLHVRGYYDFSPFSTSDSEGRQFADIIALLMRFPGVIQQNRTDFLRLIHAALKKSRGDIWPKLQRRNQSDYKFEGLWECGRDTPLTPESWEVMAAARSKDFIGEYLSGEDERKKYQKKGQKESGESNGAMTDVHGPKHAPADAGTHAAMELDAGYVVTQ